MCKPFYNKDHTKYALLISPSYGSGWSTENDSKLAWDSRVVKFWIKNHINKDLIRAFSSYKDEPLRDEALAQFESWGYKDIYFGGFSQITLRWVPINTYVRIGNYDGAEYLEIFKPSKWLNFNGEMEDKA